MRLVIDTNVVASGIFFGGKPRELLNLLFQRKVEVYASPDIIAEYQETFDYLVNKYPNRLVNTPVSQIALACRIIEPTSDIHVCRDPDDDKFISCAVDGRCIYVVSGDKDLLVLEEYKGIEIITVADFFKRLLDFENTQ